MEGEKYENYQQSTFSFAWYTSVWEHLIVYKKKYFFRHCQKRSSDDFYLFTATIYGKWLTKWEVSKVLSKCISFRGLFTSMAWVAWCKISIGISQKKTTWSQWTFKVFLWIIFTLRFVSYFGKRQRRLKVQKYWKQRMCYNQVQAGWHFVYFHC